MDSLKREANMLVKMRAVGHLLSRKYNKAETLQRRANRILRRQAEESGQNAEDENEECDGSDEYYEDCRQGAAVTPGLPDPQSLLPIGIGPGNPVPQTTAPPAVIATSTSEPSEPTPTEELTSTEPPTTTEEVSSTEQLSTTEQPSTTEQSSTTIISTLQPSFTTTEPGTTLPSTLSLTVSSVVKSETALTSFSTAFSTASPTTSLVISSSTPLATSQGLTTSITSFSSSSNQPSSNSQSSFRAPSTSQSSSNTVTNPSSTNSASISASTSYTASPNLSAADGISSIRKSTIAPGALAGIIVGLIAFTLALIIAVILLTRRASRRKRQRPSSMLSSSPFSNPLFSASYTQGNPPTTNYKFVRSFSHPILSWLAPPRDYAPSRNPTSSFQSLRQSCSFQTISDTDSFGTQDGSFHPITILTPPPPLSMLNAALRSHPVHLRGATTNIIYTPPTPPPIPPPKSPKRRTRYMSPRWAIKNSLPKIQPTDFYPPEKSEHLTEKRMEGREEKVLSLRFDMLGKGEDGRVEKRGSVTLEHKPSGRWSDPPTFGWRSSGDTSVSGTRGKSPKGRV